MTVHPVLPLPLLTIVAVLLAGAQVVALRRWRASRRIRSVLWRWLGLTCAAVLLLVAAVRPVLLDDDQAATQIAGGTDPNVFVVIDRSPDMAVPDLGERTRFDVARDDISALIDRYPTARFAVIGFASAPTLDWPLSADTWSLRPVLDALTPHPANPDAVTHTNAGAANTILRYQLISAAALYPRARNLVFYLGAGGRESNLPAREFDPPQHSVDGGAVLGYGTAAGGPIPGTDIAESAVDDAALGMIARQLGVPLVRRTDAVPLATALPGDRTPSQAAAQLDSVIGQTETYWLPAMGAAVLILIELYWMLCALRRSRLTGVELPW